MKEDDERNSQLFFAAFGAILKEHWIDEAKASSDRNRLALAGVKYGGN